MYFKSRSEDCGFTICFWSLGSSVGRERRGFFLILFFGIGGVWGWGLWGYLVFRVLFC